MQSVLARLAPYIYGVLRIAAGLMCAVHGAQKLFGLFGGRVVPLMSQAGLAGVIELAGGLLIALGLFTSVAALIASGEMAWAYFQGTSGALLLAVPVYRDARHGGARRPALTAAATKAVSLCSGTRHRPCGAAAKPAENRRPGLARTLLPIRRLAAREHQL